MTTRHFLVSAALCLVLAACTGVPIRSLPRLMQLPKDLLDANPAELMVALQVDARMVPAAGAAPMLSIKVEPREPGGFEVIDKKLPMQVAVTASSNLGLEAPTAGRRWLLYSLPAVTQLELMRIQETIKHARAQPQHKSGGSVGVGITQDALAVTDPALSHTRWETWLQIRQRDGFFEVWSGTLAQVQKSADAKR